MSRFLFLIFLFCLSSGLAEAHTRSQSSSSWQVDGQHLLMTFTVDAYRATLLASFGWDALSPSEMLAKHLPATITVEQEGKSCPLVGSNSIEAVPGTLRHQMTFQCSERITEKSTAASIEAFFELSASHQHIFYAQIGDAEPLEKILTDGHSTVNLSNDTSKVELLSLVILGFEHVLSGLDHLLFLGALVLLCHGWRQTILLISCFTLGHMGSLYLVAMGLVSPLSYLIEALIGLSIAALALAALAQRIPLPKSAPLVVVGVLILVAATYVYYDGIPVYWIAFCALFLFIILEVTRLALNPSHSLLNSIYITALFSLAHGAGFAGGLIKAGFQDNALIKSIMLFNIGVELGQILIAVMFFVVLFFVNKLGRPTFYRRMELVTALALIWMGSYYFFARLLG